MVVQACLQRLWMSILLKCFQNIQLSISLLLGARREQDFSVCVCVCVMFVYVGGVSCSSREPTHENSASKRCKQAARYKSELYEHFYLFFNFFKRLRPRRGESRLVLGKPSPINIMLAWATQSVSRYLYYTATIFRIQNVVSHMKSFSLLFKCGTKKKHREDGKCYF